MAKRKSAGKGKGKDAKDPPPEIALIGEIYEDAEADVVKDLLDVPPGDEVTIYFDTSGGSVYAALAITTLLRLRRLKATGVVVGECSSAALLIFAACQRRFVTARSVFLFHRVKWRSEKDMRREEAANWSNHFQWLETEMDHYQNTLFGGGGAKIQEWVEQSRFVLGPELVELGVAELLEVP